MANNIAGICQHPFLQEDLFPTTGGFVQGRYCEMVPTPHGLASCCLPCPVAPWRYGDGAINGTEAASWLSVCTFPLCVVLLVSYAVLHPKWTHRHYLSICITLGICCMQLAFIIPLGSDPEQCYNEITPKGMHDDLSCAFTGALLLFGGWMVIIWSFIRTVAFHLQVCWEILLGNKFMWGALICGWGIPAVGLAIMLSFTGVSFRFGKVCHINIENSIYDYWIPILVFAATALLLQLATMSYCIHVYIRTLFNRNLSTNSEGLPSYAASVRSINARQAYRRICKVFRLQWRGVTMVFIVIANAILFAVVFIKLDNATKPSPENFRKSFPWLICLALTQGDKDTCRLQVKDLGPNESTILAVMVFLSLVGLWNFLLFARPSMLVGWANLFKNKPNHPPKDFVSADARTLLPNSADAQTYEMLCSPTAFQKLDVEAMARSPIPDRAGSTKSPEGGYSYNATKPSMSLSTPIPPQKALSLSRGREWDPRATFAPSQGRDSR